jgi:hypothetical protein
MRSLCSLAFVIALQILCFSDLGIAQIRKKIEDITEPKSAITVDVLDHPAIKKLRDDIETAKNSSQTWAAQGFIDPNYQNEPIRGGTIDRLKSFRAVRGARAQRFLDPNSALAWSGVCVKNGSMLSYFVETLGTTAERHSTLLANFRKKAAKPGGLSPEEAERYAILKEITSDPNARIKRSDLSRLTFTRGVIGEEQVFRLNEAGTSMKIEPMPLNDWPSLLLDPDLSKERNDVIGCRKALITATQNMNEASLLQDSADAKNVEAVSKQYQTATREWAAAGKALMKSVDQLQLAYQNKKSGSSQPISHNTVDASRYLERLRHGTNRLIADAEVDAISLNLPETENAPAGDGVTSAVPEDTVSVLELLAFCETNGLEFGRAHSADENAYRDVAAASRTYYQHLWALQEVVRAPQAQLKEVEAAVLKQQEYDKEMLEIARDQERFRAMAETARAQAEAFSVLSSEGL